MSATTVSGLIRGCGKRLRGACYAVVPMSPYGMPLEHFLFDPPVVVDAKELGLSPIGVKLLRRPGDLDVYDVYDIVGADSYPNVSDFVEEARRFGVSRRLSSAIDFSLLTEKSKLILLHSKAFILNPDDYHPGCKFDCPKEIAEHNAIWSAARPEKLPGRTTIPSCIGLWNHDIEDGERGIIPSTGSEVSPDYADTLKETIANPRYVRRVMPSFEYFGYSRPEGVTPQYSLAIFGAFPIARLAVIDDPLGKTHERTLAKAKAAKLDVAVEEE